MATADLSSTYGALMTGMLFATFFQGVLSLQVYIYYENFPQDSWRMKVLVGAVWCIDLLHLIIISQNNYHYLVDTWGNVPALEISTWQGDLHPAVSGVATIICQLFFLYRIWVFSNYNKSLVAVLTALCLTTFALDIVISVSLVQNTSVTEFSSLTKEAIVLFSMGAGTDVIMALLLCYYVRRARSGYEKSNYIVRKIVRYTITTGLATSLLAIGCLVAYFASPNSLNFIAIHFSLGRAYTNSFVANLNSRRKLQAVRGRKDADTAQVAKSGSASTEFHFRNTDTITGRTEDASIQIVSNAEGEANNTQKIFHDALGTDAMKLNPIQNEVTIPFEV